jgi:hypothetical protein
MGMEMRMERGITVLVDTNCMHIFVIARKLRILCDL